MYFDRLDGILGTRWIKTATGSKKEGGQAGLVKTNQKNKIFRQYFLNHKLCGGFPCEEFC